MPPRKEKPTPRLTAEAAIKMTPTVGAAPSQVKGMQDAKAAPDELAQVKPRSAKVRFTGAVPKKSAPKKPSPKDRRSRNKP